MNLNSKEISYLRKKQRPYFNVGIKNFQYASFYELLKLTKRLQEVNLKKSEVSYLKILYGKSGSFRINYILSYVSETRTFSIWKVSKNLKRANN